MGIKILINLLKKLPVNTKRCTNVGLILAQRRKLKKGTRRFSRSHECLASHACVLGSNPADPVLFSAE